MCPDGAIEHFIQDIPPVTLAVLLHIHKGRCWRRGKVLRGRIYAVRRTRSVGAPKPGGYR